MKRKASQSFVTPSWDPRSFQWHVFRRDEFVDFRERVWHRAREQHGIVSPLLEPVHAEHDVGPEGEEPLQPTVDNDSKAAETLNQPKSCNQHLTSLRLVKLQDGSTASYVRPHDAVRKYKLPSIVIAFSTEDFRLLAETQDLGSSVLEIGCSTGQTSRILWKRCDHWLGWDVGKSMVDTLQQDISNINKSHKKNFLCSKIDPIIDPENAWSMVLDHFSTRHQLSIMMDIGGNRDAKAIAKILKWALGLSSKEIQMIVIKSEEMHSFNDPLAWFLSLDEVDIKTFPTHPLKAPKRCLPSDPAIPICRYFNYHPQGCKKGSDCEFDHSHCHWCLKTGHRALSCPEMMDKK